MKILLVFIIISLSFITYALFVHKSKECIEHIGDSELFKQLTKERDEQIKIQLELANLPKLGVSSNYAKYVQAIDSNDVFVTNEDMTYYVENGVSSFALFDLKVTAQTSTLVRAKDINNVDIGELNCRVETDIGSFIEFHVDWLCGYNFENRITCRARIEQGQLIGVLLAGDFFSVHMNIITYSSDGFNKPNNWTLLDAQSLKFTKAQPIPFIFSMFKRLPIMFISEGHEPATINIIAQFKKYKSSTH